MNSKTKKLFSVILLTCFITLSLFSTVNAQTATPTPTPTASPTPTVTPTPTPTPHPTLTPSPTPTASPTPTPTPTNGTQPTPTPTPTNNTNDDYFYAPTKYYHVNLPNYPLYAPVHIVVNYAYTQNYTVNVQTFGLSLHRETSSPTSIAFDSSALDSYRIHISVRYQNWINQTVTISIRENNTAAKLIQFDTYAQGFDVDMMVTTSQAPSFPTADEIADNLWFKWQNVLNDLKGSNANLVDSLLGSYAVNAGFAFIAFAITMVLLIVVIYLARRQARFDHFIHSEG